MSVGGVVVVIPAYRVSDQILDVIGSIGPEVEKIFVVDDACPDGSGQKVADSCNDPRVTVLFNEVNRGVGGAMVAGYKAAIEAGASVVVKIDGDGQMDPALAARFIRPVLMGQADYAKGNRFYNLDGLQTMPGVRLFGNAVLSFVSKFSTGYWHLFDPTNGYTAVHVRALQSLPLEKLSQGYFFESDMLFRLNTIRAVVVDIPMDAKYDEEVSSLRIRSVAPLFLKNHLRNFFKRVFYNYFLRDMSIASLELLFGSILFLFGFVYGTVNWITSANLGVFSSSGTVMLSALSVLLGIQFILAFFSYDMNNHPRMPFHKAVEHSPLSLEERTPNER